MRRYRAYVQPLMALLAVCILLITGGLYMLSNRLVSNSYAGLSRQEISQCVSIGQRLLADYRSGEITLDELREAVNPTLNPAEAFLLLTDPEGNVLCAIRPACAALDPGINAKRGAAARRQSCYRAYAAFDGAAHARRRGAGR